MPVASKQREHKLADALIVADRVVEALRVACERIEVVGSVRRKRFFVHDVDLVVIPMGEFIKTKAGGKAPMPGRNRWEDIPRLIRDLGGRVLRKGPAIISAVIDEDIQIDINCATGENWGILHLLKTGPQEFNIELCQRANTQGKELKVMSGIWKDGELIASLTEKEVLSALGLPYVEPQCRDAAVDKLRRGELLM